MSHRWEEHIVHGKYLVIKDEDSDEIVAQPVDAEAPVYIGTGPTTECGAYLTPDDRRTLAAYLLEGLAP